MADKPIENILYEFLEANKASLPADSAVMPSAYDKYDGQHGVIIGDPDVAMLPNGNGEDMTEFDCLLTLEVFARVAGLDKSNRIPARQKVFDVTKALLQLFEEFPTLEGKVCSIQYLEQTRFFDDRSTEKWAIERVPVIINPR